MDLLHGSIGQLHLLKIMSHNCDPKKDCPPFSYDDFEPILTWGDVEVIRNEYSIDPNNQRHRLVIPHWCMSHKGGVITFLSLSSIEDEESARRASALFLHLWCQNVDVALAARLAEAYVNYYIG